MHPAPPAQLQPCAVPQRPPRGVGSLPRASQCKPHTPHGLDPLLWKGEQPRSICGVGGGKVGSSSSSFELERGF